MNILFKDVLVIVSFLIISVVGNSQGLELGFLSNPNYSYRTVNIDKDAGIKPEGEKAILGYDLGT
ncbi:MAG: hypothetical protein ACI8TA_003082 [Cyclobacteriaceae bacterium]|jgi:hypothetical protein